jgi:spoIIIJ-associated protein
MYEARNEAREFVGATRAEAIAKACAYFGTDEGGLRVRAPEAGEVYGLAARAVLVATPANAAPRSSSGPARSGGGREEAPRRDRGPREGRDSGRDGRRDGGREGRRGDRDGGGRPAPARDFEPVARPALDAAPADGPSVGTARSALGEAGQFVQGLIERLGLGSFEISESEDGELVVVQLRGVAVERLGGGDGRAVDAIQFLVNQIALRQNESARRIVVDAEGDTDGRESHLERLAERAAQRARETTRSVALDPMNPRDRRVIHVALRETDGIATMSVGTGRYRQVVVVPEGAPEYDQARSQAEASNQGNS